MITRPWWQLSLLIVAIACAVSSINALGQYRTGALLEPVTLRIEGVTPAAAAQIQAGYVGWRGSDGELRQVRRDSIWSIQQSQVSQLRLSVPRAHLHELQRVQITIGARNFSFSRQQLVQQWRAVPAGAAEHRSKPSQTMVLEAPPTVRAGKSRVGRLAGLVNWPGDRVAAWRIVRGPLLLVGALAVAALLMGRGKRNHPGWDGRILGLDTPSPARSVNEVLGAEKWRWAIAGAGVLVAALTLLEVSQPPYFTQSDNLAQFVPVIVHGCRNALAGVFPTWNPYQLMGAPTSSMGVYALTYPPTYLSYLIARYLLGNEYLTLEVFIVAHLLIGYAVTFWVARSLGMRPMLAAVGSLSFILSGYSLIAGRSWYYHVPVVVWAPLLVAAVVRLQRGPVSWKWVLATGSVVGAFFHAGNAQMWAYAMLFLLLAVTLLLWTGAVPVHRGVWVLPALLVGLAIAAPLLLPQRLETADIDRVGGAGAGISAGIPAMLLPYPLAQAAHPRGWGSDDHQLMGHFYYSGTLFAAAGLGAGLILLAWLVTYRWNNSLLKRLVRDNTWLVCAGVAFLFALGDHGLLWSLISRLPVFNQFDFAFKFLPYVNLFLVLGGGLVVERHLHGLKHSRRWESRIGVLVCILLIYHVLLAQPSHYTYNDRPYPPLPKAMAELLSSTDNPTPQRVLAFAPDHTPAGGYVASLTQNFATLFNVLAVEGFDPLVKATPQNGELIEKLEAEPVRAARAYGVRWLVEHRTMGQPEFGANPRQWPGERATPRDVKLLAELSRQAARRLELPDVTVWELSRSEPLAFAEFNPKEALPIRFDGSGAHIRGSQLAVGGRVVVNVLWRPNMIVRANGHLLPCQADDWGRVVAEVPTGTTRFDLQYRPRWRLGLLAGLFLAALATAAILLLSQWQGRLDTPR